MVASQNQVCGLLKLPNIGVRQNATRVVGSCCEELLEGKLKMCLLHQWPSRRTLMTSGIYLVLMPDHFTASLTARRFPDHSIARALATRRRFDLYTT